jgi:hypothetical protein
MEQVGTYSESTLRNLQPSKNSQRKVDLHIRISQENYIFLKENFRGKISETIDKLLTSFRTEQPAELKVLKIGWARPDSNRRPPPCKGSYKRGK